jgi:hypothetical protein
MQIKRTKTVAEYLSSACRTATFSTIHLRNSKYYFRYNNIMDIPQVRTSRYGKKTFKFAAATLWNSLPDHL